MITLENIGEAIDRAADAQCQWEVVSFKDRLRSLAQVRAAIVDAADELCELISVPQRRSHQETVSAELIPLCEAFRYLERHAAKVLSKRKVGAWGRPIWLWGVQGEVSRVPLGNVLVIAPWNYPLFLAGVQTAQAIAAGNAVLLKPAPGCEAVTSTLIDCFQSIVGTDLVQQVDSNPVVASELMKSSIDKIVLTGSANTGRKVSTAAAQQLTPTTMELSGCDAMLVLDGADIEKAARAIMFGLTFNSSATCIAPRRVFVHASVSNRLAECLEEMLATAPLLTVNPSARQLMCELVEDSIAQGGQILNDHWQPNEFKSTGATRPLVVSKAKLGWSIMSADLFAPVTAVTELDDLVQMIQSANDCPYGLGASVFAPVREARSVASKLNVGTVTINDVIVPTAEARIPFGGCKGSGHGTTRGPEGLLEMTRPRVIMVQGGRSPRHLLPPGDGDAEIVRGALQFGYGGGLRTKMQGLRKLISGIRSSGHKAIENTNA